MLMGELSEIGVCIVHSGASHKLGVCRADLNYGIGYMVSGPAVMTACHGLNSSNHNDGKFPSFHFSGSSATLSGCTATRNSSYAHSYGFDLSAVQQTGAGQQAMLAGCRSSSHAAGTFYAPVPGTTGHQIAFADTFSVQSGASLSADNIAAIRINAASAIAAIANGVEGQPLTLVASTAGCTIPFNATIRNNWKMAKPMDIGKPYRFVHRGGVWYEDGDGADRYGVTADRPSAVSEMKPGFVYFDTTLGRPIWRNPANGGWIDVNGNAV